MEDIHIRILEVRTIQYMGFNYEVQYIATSPYIRHSKGRVLVKSLEPETIRSVITKIVLEQHEQRQKEIQIINDLNNALNTQTKEEAKAPVVKKKNLLERMRDAYSNSINKRE